MNKSIIIVVVVVIIALAGFLLFRGGEEGGEQITQEENGTTQMQVPAPGADKSIPEAIVSPTNDENVVIYTDSGYTPSTLRVEVGETITFKNESSRKVWTASAIHPVHRAYPGSDIKKCGTQEEQNIFDECAGHATGEAWSFTFNNAGEWQYHNHLRSSHTGKIIVEQ